MSQRLSRRDFLKMSGLAAAASTLPLSSLPLAAQDGGIEVLLRSTFLTPVSQLFESIIASWADNNGVPVNFTWSTFEVLNDTLVSASATGAGRM